MNETFGGVIRALDGSAVHALALKLLGEVPGFPPMVQTVHLLGIAAIMGSVVVIDLKVLGLALPSQGTADVIRRLMPWTWWALPFLATSGLVFVFARPHRYFVNPVFGSKFAMLIPALALAATLQLLSARNPRLWDEASAARTSAKLIAAVSLVLWIGVVLAGRWIAYADYIFNMG
jgi:hypothetical protein